MLPPHVKCFFKFLLKRIAEHLSVTVDLPRRAGVYIMAGAEDEDGCFGWYTDVGAKGASRPAERIESTFTE